MEKALQASGKRISKGSESTWPRILESALATVAGGLVVGLGHLLEGRTSGLFFGALAGVIGVAILVMLATLFFARVRRPSPDVENLKARLISAYAGALEASALKPESKEPHSERRT